MRDISERHLRAYELLAVMPRGELELSAGLYVRQGRDSTGGLDAVEFLSWLGPVQGCA
ncbi:MAG: hypothetical protein NZ989_06835 [Bacteroidia bacterium]|nr:hypothetical protein [Bacteroidia bacterium]